MIMMNIESFEQPNWSLVMFLLGKGPKGRHPEKKVLFFWVLSNLTPPLVPPSSHKIQKNSFFRDVFPDTVLDFLWFEKQKCHLPQKLQRKCQ